MKLRIENIHARDAQFGVAHAAPRRAGGQAWLELVVEPQRESRWCWAAIGVALAAYYHGHRVEQAAVAGVENAERPLDEVLAALGCYGHWSLGKPTFERVAFEIDHGRPLCARIGWYAGGAHYVLIRGYDSIRRALFVEDSLSGPSRPGHHDFPATYAQRGGVWTETFWTEPQRSLVSGGLHEQL